MLATFIQQVINGLMLGGSYALVAIGYTLIFGVLNLLHLAHGEVAMIGSYIGLTLVLTAMSQVGVLPIWVVLVVAMLGAAVFGLSGCDKPKERTRDKVAIAAAIEQAQREDAEADRQMRERAAQQEQERREAEQAAIDAHVAEEEARRVRQTRASARVQEPRAARGSARFSAAGGAGAAAAGAPCVAWA